MSPSELSGPEPGPLHRHKYLTPPTSAKGNCLKPCTREQSSLGGCFNFTEHGILQQIQRPAGLPSCPSPPAANARLWKVVSPSLLLKPEILLMPLRGSSRAGAPDPLSVRGTHTLPGSSHTANNTRKRKEIHCKAVSDDCPSGEVRNPGQGKAGEGRRVVGGGGSWKQTQNHQDARRSSEPLSS